MKYICIHLFLALFCDPASKSLSMYKLLDIYCYSDKFDFCSILLFHVFLCQQFEKIFFHYVEFSLPKYVPFGVKKGFFFQCLIPFPLGSHI